MKCFIFTIALTFICSCGLKGHEDQIADLIIKETESEGYKYIGLAKTPAGICDTIMRGYTDWINGNYFNKTERFNELKISGYEFEEISDQLYKSKLMVYSFVFNDLNEKEKFENFQKYILNYQRRYKNGAEFYKRNSNWFLKFIPMP